MKFVVIGISDNPNPFFPPEVLEVIKNGRIFSGGKRHHEIVAQLLPADAEWIDITVPLDAVFEQYRALSGFPAENPVIVFASGDPLFFGFANTIKKKMPDADIVVFPTFNSLQMLAHKLVMPYHDMRIVSLTGRPWQEFDRALIEGAPKMGVLTDKEHTPAAIAQRMLDYGFDGYTMHIGEHLGNPTLERITTLSLEAAAQQGFQHPNCLILNTNFHELDMNFSQININDNSCSINGNSRPNYIFGIPDHQFVLLNGREKMITKMPIRLLTLQALDLPHRHVLWDIGFCTGSVSIEARLRFPHLHIDAFEVRPECKAIIQENARRFHAPGIHVHMGDFLNLQSSIFNIPPPDAVFIGGHGGHLKDIMAKVLTCLSPDGIIVMNSVIAPKVTTDSHRLWDEACAELGLHQEPPMRIQLNDHHPITILKCRR